MKIIKSIIFGLIILSVSSCSEEFQKKLESTPNALGVSNQIVVIADQQLWDSEVGDTFRFYFEAAYPMMPSPEPIFDIMHFTPTDLIEGPTRKELRTYLFLADLNDNSSATAKVIIKDIGEEKAMKIKQEGAQNNIVGRNKWAVGQLMIYMGGKNNEDLFDNIKKSFSSISMKVYEHDLKQLKGYTYASGYNKALKAEVSEKLNVNVEVPADYIKALWDEDKKMIWLRKETNRASFGMVIRELPYTSKDQFTEDYLKDLVNEFGKEYVTTNTPGSHLVVNDEDLPIYTSTKDINGQYTYEIRGIWEATKDFMGGPFFAYLIMDKSQEKLLFVYDFLLAPGEEKRNLMQQLELMTNSLEML